MSTLVHSRCRRMPEETVTATISRREDPPAARATRRIVIIDSSLIWCWQPGPVLRRWPPGDATVRRTRYAGDHIASLVQMTRASAW